MHPHYSHLCFSDRLTIEVMLAEGHSQRQVAFSIGVHPTTIGRERKLGLVAGSSRYFAVVAQRLAEARRVRAGQLRRKFDVLGCSPYWKLVLPLLRRGWSPEQAAGRLRLMDSPCTVSHETIYAAIYAMPRSTLRTELVKLLRHSHAGRLPLARGSARFTGLQNMTPIALRPPEVAARIVPGHWEADLIKGARNASAVGTIVERTSRFLLLARMDSAGAASVLDGFSRRLRSVPPSLRKTLTYDQGTEMALHQDLAKRLRMDIYFCDPHSPWQRGTNENMNGLVRQYLPKGVSLASLTDDDLRRIEDSINNRPRKLLGFYTPTEVFSALKQDDILGVALQA
jgi:transposase, IS30 family